MNFIIKLDYSHQCFLPLLILASVVDIILLQKDYINFLLFNEFQGLKYAVSAEFLSIDLGLPSRYNKQRKKYHLRIKKKLFPNTKQFKGLKKWKISALDTCISMGCQLLF